MHLTLHLTDSCNLSCKYCYVKQGDSSMSFSTAKDAVEMAIEDKKPSGLIFFGGEPLLKRELIYQIVEYSQKRQIETGHKFYYKITTNGTLLDEKFMRFADSINMVIGFSHDGFMQDDFRVYPDGRGTFLKLLPKIDLLLHYQPYAIAMCTVNPESVFKLSSSVEWLFNRGFRYIITSLNYDASAPWDEKSLKELEKQYKEMAKLYIKWTLADEKFYLGVFEMKILSHLHGERYCSDRCQLGKKQISVAPDGRLYPCVQFVWDDEYCIGDVKTGIDIKKREEIQNKGDMDPESCKDCAIKDRCNFTCGCLNRQSTGRIDLVSPVQCANERMLMPIADNIAEKLYKKRNALFLHKQYNEFYPVLSLVEDRLR